MKLTIASALVASTAAFAPAFQSSNVGVSSSSSSLSRLYWGNDAVGMNSAPPAVPSTTAATGPGHVGAGGMADTRDPDAMTHEDPRKSISAAPSFADYMASRGQTVSAPVPAAPVPEPVVAAPVPPPVAPVYTNTNPNAVVQKTASTSFSTPPAAFANHPPRPKATPTEKFRSTQTGTPSVSDFYPKANPIVQPEGRKQGSGGLFDNTARISDGRKNSFLDSPFKQEGQRFRGQTDQNN